MVFVVLFFIPVLLVLLIAMLIPEPKAQTFKKGERVRFTHWPGRTAEVVEFYDPKTAKEKFPHGVKGAEKSPYPSGVVEAKFVDLDPSTGKPYPNEIAAGNFVKTV